MVEKWVDLMVEMKAVQLVGHSVWKKVAKWVEQLVAMMVERRVGKMVDCWAWKLVGLTVVWSVGKMVLMKVEMWAEPLADRRVLM